MWTNNIILWCENGCISQENTIKTISAINVKLYISLTRLNSRGSFAEQVLHKSFDVDCWFCEGCWTSRGHCLWRLDPPCLSSLLSLIISADTFWHSASLLSPAGISPVVTLGRSTRDSSVCADGRAERCPTKNNWLIYESEKPQMSAGLCTLLFCRALWGLGFCFWLRFTICN